MNIRSKEKSKLEAEGRNSISGMERAASLQPLNSPLQNIFSLQKGIGNQAVKKLFKSSVIQARLEVGQAGDIYEQEADRVAEQVMHTPEALVPRQIEEKKEGGDWVQPKSLFEEINPSAQRKGGAKQEEKEKEEILRTQEAPGQTSKVTPDIESFLKALKGGGQPLPRSVRSFFEPRFSQDLGRVRIHTNQEAAKKAQALNARAFTIGQSIYFGSGQYSPDTRGGKRLLAHELAHIVQRREERLSFQQKKTKRARRKVEEELEDWFKKKGYSLDPNDIDYAINNYFFVSEELIPQKRYTEAYSVARLILIKSGEGVLQKEVRAGMIAGDLAQRGSIKEAMEIADLLSEKEQIGYIYEAVVNKAVKATKEQLETITKFFIYQQKKSLNDHPVMNKLTAGKCEFSKNLGKNKLRAILDILIDNYKKSDDLMTNVAKILIFYREFRNYFSTWMWEKDKEYLFKLLESEYFIEPGYGPTVFEGMELTMARDMPWVYSWKQRYYIEYIVELGKRSKIDIPKPAMKPKMKLKVRFEVIKKWLDDNTELIGEALAKMYSEEPEKITRIYEQIADIFFYHVERGDVKANLSGKLAHLKPGAPQKMRIRADCDVLATYATRFLYSVDFKPVGYLLILPDVGDGHAAALLKKEDIYYAVSNKEISKLSSETEKGAISELKRIALEIYEEEPVPYKVFYAKSEEKGKMPEGLGKGEDAYLLEYVK